MLFLWQLLCHCGNISHVILIVTEVKVIEKMLLDGFNVVMTMLKWMCFAIYVVINRLRVFQKMVPLRAITSCKNYRTLSNHWPSKVAG